MTSIEAHPINFRLNSILYSALYFNDSTSLPSLFTSHAWGCWEAKWWISIWKSCWEAEWWICIWKQMLVNLEKVARYEKHHYRHQWIEQKWKENMGGAKVPCEDHKIHKGECREMIEEAKWIHGKILQETCITLNQWWSWIWSQKGIFEIFLCIARVILLGSKTPYGQLKQHENWFSSSIIFLPNTLFHCKVHCIMD